MRKISKDQLVVGKIYYRQFGNSNVNDSTRVRITDIRDKAVMGEWIDRHPGALLFAYDRFTVAWYEDEPTEKKGFGKWINKIEQKDEIA